MSHGVNSKSVAPGSTPQGQVVLGLGKSVVRVPGSARGLMTLPIRQGLLGDRKVRLDSTHQCTGVDVLNVLSTRRHV